MHELKKYFFFFISDFDNLLIWEFFDSFNDIVGKKKME